MKLAERMHRLGTESAFEVLARAKELERKGKEVIHLEIGEPDFKTPQNICDSAKDYIDKGYTHYTPSQGLYESREAIAKYIEKTRGIQVDPDEVVITPGGKPILFYAILTFVEPGDEVIIPDPAYPIYESVVRFVNGIPRLIPLREELGFRWDLNELKDAITSSTKMIILNSPHNPTGCIFPMEDLKVIAELAQENDLIVVSDEIYSRLIYEGRHESIITFPGMKERTILMDGFSKTYAMTGWRLGYGIMAKDFIPHFTRLVTNTVSCATSFVQLAGIEALMGDQTDVEAMVAEFKERRDVIIQGLNEIEGISCKKPQGAFYAFPNIQSLGMKSKDFADLLLQEYGVAVLSGTAFGPAGEGYLRLSYANSLENIRKALDRIREAVEAVKG